MAEGDESVSLSTLVTLEHCLVFQKGVLDALLLVLIETCESFQHCLSFGIVLRLEPLLSFENKCLRDLIEVTEGLCSSHLTQMDDCGILTCLEFDQEVDLADPPCEVPLSL